MSAVSDDKEMRQCLEEMLERLVQAAKGLARTTAADLVDDDYSDSDERALAYAVGYLYGAADASNVTVRTLLEEYDLDLGEEG